MITNATWSRVHINYVASSRDDLLVGQFIGNSIELLDMKNIPKTIKLIHYYGDSRKWKIGNTAMARTFICGIQSTDKFIQIGINQSKVDVAQSMISLDLTITSQKAPIETLVMTYVIYTSLFTGLQVTVINQLEMSVSVLKNSLENIAVNAFVGLTQINLNEISQRLLVELNNLVQFTKKFAIQALNF